MKPFKIHMTKKTLILLIFFFLILVGILIFFVIRYNIDSVNRPVTNPVFQMDREDVDMFRIVNGNTGKIIVVEDDETIVEMVDTLNAFHYLDAKPKNPEPSSGYSYMLWIHTSGNQEILSYQFTPDSILVKNFWYYGNASSFDNFADMVSETGE